jgi:hypothetical protein
MVVDVVGIALLAIGLERLAQPPARPWVPRKHGIRIVAAFSSGSMRILRSAIIVKDRNPVAVSTRLCRTIP